MVYHSLPETTVPAQSFSETHFGQSLTTSLLLKHVDNRKIEYLQDCIVQNKDKLQSGSHSVKLKPSKELHDICNKVISELTFKTEDEKNSKEETSTKNKKKKDLADVKKHDQIHDPPDPEVTFVKGCYGGDQNEEPPSLPPDGLECVSKIDKDLEDTEKQSSINDKELGFISTDTIDSEEETGCELSEKEKKIEKESYTEKDICHAEELNENEEEGHEQNFVSDSSQFHDLAEKGQIVFDDYLYHHGFPEVYSAVSCDQIETKFEQLFLKEDLQNLLELVTSFSKKVQLHESSGYRKELKQIENLELLYMDFLKTSCPLDHYAPWLPKWKGNNRKGIPPFKYRIRSYMNSGGSGTSGKGSQTSNSSQGGGSNHANEALCGKSNKNNSNRGGIGRGEDDDDDDRDRLPRRNSADRSNIPPDDYKAPKKKHSSLTQVQLFELLGTLGLLDTKIEDLTTLSTYQECMACLVMCMSNLDYESETTSCLVCAVIDGLLIHLAKCMETFLDCRECKQINMLVFGHVEICLQLQSSSQSGCIARLCRRIQRAVSKNVEVLQANNKLVIKKLKKYLQDSMHLTVEFDASIEGLPSLESLNIPGVPLFDSKNEQAVLTDIKPTVTHTGVASAQMEENIEASTQPKIRRSSMRRSLKMPSIKEDFNEESVVNNRGLTLLEEEKTSLRAEILIENELTSQIRNAQFEDTGAWGFDEKVYGDKRPFTSLPPSRKVGGYIAGEQLLSLEDRPTGVPGIGEVVYGNRNQLLKVAQHWNSVKEQYRKGDKIRQQNREEGVILSNSKENLQICKTRYQPMVQWQKLVHLGNGMSGKCNLASDRNTDFQFCVKVIHISHFEYGELSIWSELNHINIPKLYGALRVGEDIYLFNEFIDGGCVTEHINQQKRCKRRFSQKTALNYLKQLLNVLFYLKQKNIVHEDIKCDNILLVRGKTDLKVCDFGLARHVHKDKDFKKSTPIGTQTQWSPEKAASIGYSFPADLWAVTCSFIHMLSGYPPWIKRFPNMRVLHVIIHSKSPPVQDIPKHLQQDVRNLIEEGLTVDPDRRPTPGALLRHPAFNLIEPGVNEIYYSTLANSQGSSGGSDSLQERKSMVIYDRTSVSSPSFKQNGCSSSDACGDTSKQYPDDLERKMKSCNLNEPPVSEQTTPCAEPNSNLKRKLNLNSDQLEQVLASLQTPQSIDDRTDLNKVSFKYNLPNILDDVDFTPTPPETVDNLPSSANSSIYHTFTLSPKDDDDTFTSEELFSPGDIDPTYDKTDESVKVRNLLGKDEQPHGELKNAHPDDKMDESIRVRSASGDHKQTISEHKNANLHLNIGLPNTDQFGIGRSNNQSRVIADSSSSSSGIGLTPTSFIPSARTTPMTPHSPRFERKESGYEPDTPSSTRSTSGKSHQEQADEELKTLLEMNMVFDEEPDPLPNEPIDDELVNQQLERLQSTISNPVKSGARITFKDRSSLNRSVSFSHSDSGKDLSEILEQIASKIHDDWGYKRFVVSDEQGNYLNHGSAIGDNDVSLFIHKIEEEDSSIPWWIEDYTIRINFM